MFVLETKLIFRNIGSWDPRTESPLDHCEREALLNALSLSESGAADVDIDLLTINARASIGSSVFTSASYTRSKKRIDYAIQFCVG